MRILLVEDDERKREHIVSFLSTEVEDVSVGVARSYRSSLEALVKGSFDLVILDMTIPTYDVTVHEPGGRPHAFGGREILHQMIRRKLLTSVVVLTQYEQFGEGNRASTLEELDGELSDTFGEQYLGAIHYSPSLDDWKDRLRQIVEGSR